MVDPTALVSAKWFRRITSGAVVVEDFNAERPKSAVLKQPSTEVKSRVERLVGAYDLEGDNDLARRVNEFAVKYSPLKSAPALIGPRLNQIPQTEELLATGDDVMEWLGDAMAVGEALQIAIEFLRSRLPGYPILRVPHRRRGSPYLPETDPFFFHYFPWTVIWRDRACSSRSRRQT